MDSETSHYDKLIAQCKSNDVDVKIDALSKLQAHFEKGALEVPDPDALTGILKSFLRTSNLHLTNATLSALPAILPSLITRPAHTAQPSSNVNLAASSSTSSVSPSSAFDVANLRSALNAFLPAGGIVDRLGDKEKAQVKAREALVLLGGYAFRAGGGSAISNKSGKGQEPPIAIFERILKEAGLASKVWKVREQAVITLVHIRRVHHLFPIRPYLSLLVDCLEDTDAHVRDCARLSIVELFTGPAVSDAARADLKKEMTKKNVRKTIVDGVLAKLLGGTSVPSNPQSREGSENGDTKREYVPPSVALQAKRRVASQPVVMSRAVSQSNAKEISRPASRAAMSSPVPPQTPSADNVDIQPVYIASSRDLEHEFAAMQKPFEGKENEHNWAARDQAIQRVRGMLKGDVHNRYTEPFLIALKDGFIQWSLKTLASLRTTVAVNTCLLYAELAVAIGALLDPHCEVLFTNLLKMAGFTKKITAQQSQISFTTIVTNTSAQPRVVIPLLWITMQEKIAQARAFVITHIKHYLEVHGHRSKSAIEASNTLESLEKALKRALTDPTPAVKESARASFWVFEDIWAERGLSIMDTLDATARKQLEKACPNPNGQTPLPPSTPKVTKKSSVAAAIAASRAKAKAIATAPPSLRHQATSSSYAAAPRREVSPNTSPKSTTNRPNSPQRIPTSPSSLVRRAASPGLVRSVSSGIGPVISTSHTRTPSGGSDKAGRSASPSLSDSLARRRQSSPLSGPATGSTIRKALTTALPASPPSSIGQVSPTPRRPFASRDGAAVPLPPRQSLHQMDVHGDESLLMAQTVPIPEDSDSEDESVNLMSFSAPFEMFPPNQSKPRSYPATLSPVSDSRPTASVSNALSSGSMSDMAASQQFVVEDALRARAEQAESAAERLLELVEPEDEDTMHHHTLPPSLLRSTNGHSATTAKVKSRPVALPMTRSKTVPETPNNRAKSIMRQAALFIDSPAQKNGKATSLLDALQDHKQETAWWLKRKAVVAQASPITARVSEVRVHELESFAVALAAGTADVNVLKRLALICVENSVAEPSSPTPDADDVLPSSPTPLGSLPASNAVMWEENKTFDSIFKALITYLQPSKTEDELAIGLIVAWEMLENLLPYLEGKEGDLFSMILRVRYSNKIAVLEGTNAIRDALTTKLDPVYGLTTMHASLRVFHSEPPPTMDDEEVKAATYAFGLMALGKFVLRLPAEIAEEELPRLKSSLITSLNDRSSLIIRESAAACIIAAQLVLQDETHLFTLLDGLADEKKNLLTYLFDKHGARSIANSNDQSGMDKLEREMRRLDTRTSTPLRGGL